MSSVISSLFGGKPRRPDRVSQPAKQVTGADTQVARDELLSRMAKLRAANVRDTELSNPNIKRRQLGAGV